MKRMGLRVSGAVLVVAALCGLVCLAGAAGYSARYALPASGELLVRNTQRNAIWRHLWRWYS